MARPLLPEPCSPERPRGVGSAQKCKEERQSHDICQAVPAPRFCWQSLFSLPSTPPPSWLLLTSDPFHQRPPSSQLSAVLSFFFDSPNNCPKILSQNLPQIIPQAACCLGFSTTGKVAPQSPQKDLQRIKGADLGDCKGQKTL